VVTTERFHAEGRRDFIILAQRGEAADKLIQIFQGKIIGNSISVFGTRIHPKGILASLKRLHSNPQKVCNDLHTRKFCPFGILELLDVRNQRVGGCPFFGCRLCVPRFAPLDIFRSIKGSKAIILGSQRFVLDIKPLLAPALDRVSKLHIKVSDFWPDADADTTYVGDGVLRVVVAEVKDVFPQAPVRVDAQEAFAEGDEDRDVE
jgi:hypothetical protein